MHLQKGVGASLNVEYFFLMYRVCNYFNNTCRGGKLERDLQPAQKKITLKVIRFFVHYLMDMTAF